GHPHNQRARRPQPQTLRCDESCSWKKSLCPGYVRLMVSCLCTDNAEANSSSCPRWRTDRSPLIQVVSMSSWRTAARSQVSERLTESEPHRAGQRSLVRGDRCEYPHTL